MQMISLKYYLQAAKNNDFVGQKSSSIKAINELAKAYQIFKYNPKKPRKFLSIETLIKRNNKAEIQNRIDYVDAIIEKAS
jgi:DNA/RNA-binding domain of Phe-tRNA-synthetase-like protein